VRRGDIRRAIAARNEYLSTDIHFNEAFKDQCHTGNSKLKLP
jgi:hypothetical protein